MHGRGKIAKATASPSARHFSQRQHKSPSELHFVCSEIQLENKYSKAGDG